MNQRRNKFYAWVASQVVGEITHIEPIASGGGTRQYLRLYQGNKTWIAVDAPPATEKVREFVALSSILNAEGVLVPEVIASDEIQGFLLVSDFGSRTLLSVLNSENVDHHYRAAMDALIPIHHSKKARVINRDRLGGDFLRNELSQFVTWYLKTHQEIIIDNRLKAMLDNLFDALVESADAQEQVCCHRDYHSDNIMVLPDDRLGIVDFQDMRMGPITYDVVSLLRDCYVVWPEERVAHWTELFYQRLRYAGFLQDVSLDVFMRWFDWMGMQRHIKALATFAAKVHRDGDTRFLSAIPRTLRYLENVSARYPEFSEFNAFVQEINLETV